MAPRDHAPALRRLPLAPTTRRPLNAPPPPVKAGLLFASGAVLLSEGFFFAQGGVTDIHGPFAFSLALAAFCVGAGSWGVFCRGHYPSTRRGLLMGAAVGVATPPVLWLFITLADALTGPAGRPVSLHASRWLQATTTSWIVAGWLTIPAAMVGGVVVARWTRPILR